MLSIVSHVYWDIWVLLGDLKLHCNQWCDFYYIPLVDILKNQNMNGMFPMHVNLDIAWRLKCGEPKTGQLLFSESACRIHRQLLIRI